MPGAHRDRRRIGRERLRQSIIGIDETVATRPSGGVSVDGFEHWGVAVVQGDESPASDRGSGLRVDGTPNGLCCGNIGVRACAEGRFIRGVSHRRAGCGGSGGMCRAGGCRSLRAGRRCRRRISPGPAMPCPWSAVHRWAYRSGNRYSAGVRLVEEMFSTEGALGRRSDIGLCEPAHPSPSGARDQVSVLGARPGSRAGRRRSACVRSTHRVGRRRATHGN